MDTWTLQAGFPVVEAESLGPNTIRLSQRRFLVTNAKTDSSKWVVPINFAYPGKDGFNVTLPSHWMLPDEPFLELTLKQKPYIVNVQETGFYRVNYEAENWKGIASLMKTDHMLVHELNRAQVLDDAMNLARVHQLPYEVTPSLTVGNHCFFAPWPSGHGIRLGI